MVQSEWLVNQRDKRYARSERAGLGKCRERKPIQDSRTTGGHGR